MNTPLHKALVMISCSHITNTKLRMQIQPYKSALADSADLNRDLLYFAGRWLSLGLLRFRRKAGVRKQYDAFVTIWMSAEEQHTRLFNAAANILDKMAGYQFCRPAPRGKEILIHAPALDEWLIMHFKCNNRFMPEWVYDMPETYRRALLDGLIDGATLCFEPTCRFFVVDKRFAREIKRLAKTLGYAPSMHAGLPTDPSYAEPHYSGAKPVYTIDLHAPVCHTDKANT